MDSSSHTPACAFLVCAEAFLCQGVEKLIRERHPQCDNMPAEDICRLCCAVVHAQRDDVITNVQTLLGRYNCKLGRSGSFVNTEHDMLLDPSDPKCLYTSCCEETLGTHGRSLEVNQSVGRGHILLKESPYAAVKCGHCACAVGNVLSEHIILATVIDQSKDKNPEKYAQFLSTFYSGLIGKESIFTEKDSESSVGQYKHRPSTTTVEARQDPQIERNGSHTWSLTTQILMALVCAIHNLHQMQLEDGRLDTINKMSLFDKTWKLMQVLSRLPHNTHAVSCVVANNKNRYAFFVVFYKCMYFSCLDPVYVHILMIYFHCLTLPCAVHLLFLAFSASREVEQMRLGYAVFLHASSINHSCAPNASIRYSTLPSTTSIHTLYSTINTKPYASIHGVHSTAGNKLSDTVTSTEVDPALEYLRRIQIEIISTTPISSYKHTTSNNNSSDYLNIASSEVCVSYGPLQGVHNVQQRRKVLHTQYLFHCECSACLNDTVQNNKKHSVAPTTYPIDPTLAVVQQLDQVLNTTLHDVAPVVQNAVRHINHIMRAENDTKHLHDTLTLLKQQLEQINPLFTSVLHHTKNNQNSHLLDSFVTKKLVPLHERIVHLQVTYFPLAEKLNEKRKFGLVCEESIYRADPLYVDFCAVYCNYVDIYAHILALQLDFKAACMHVYYAIMLMVSSGMYYPLDVVIGRERVKLAGLLLSMGHKQDCAVQVRCALEILQPVVSRDDPDVMEAKNMLAFCRT